MSSYPIDPSSIDACSSLSFIRSRPPGLAIAMATLHPHPHPHLRPHHPLGLALGGGAFHRIVVNCARSRSSSSSSCPLSNFGTIQMQIQERNVALFYCPSGSPFQFQFSSSPEKKKRPLVAHATTEEIQLEKSKVEGSAKDKMDKAIDAVQSSFNTVRTGRSNPAMLDRIEVEYYGTPVGLNTIAQISTPDGASLLVQPYDKSSLKEIEKAIVKSNLGFTPTNDGQAIRISVPQPTAERRKELLKVVGKLTEEGKVAIRNIRRDAIKSYDKLEKEKKLSKDNVKDLSDDIQKLTDQYIKKVESLQREKEKEIMTV